MPRMDRVSAWVKRHKVWTAVIAVLVIGGIASGISGSGSGSDGSALAKAQGSPTNAAASDDSNGFAPDVVSGARQLMTEDGATDLTDYEVSYYRWSSACKDGDGAAREIDNADEDLVRNGITMSRLKLMRTVANSAFTQTSDEDCAGDLAAYLVLREPS